MTEPDLNDWRAAVAQELKGRTAESLRGETEDGVPIEPLYGFDHAPAALPLRGDGQDASWQILAEVRLADPEAAAAAAIGSLRHGADGLHVTLDLATRRGIAPGEDGVSAGAGGVALHALDDVRALVAAVPAGTPTWFDCGASGLPLLASLLEATGENARTLQGGLGHDPLRQLWTAHGVVARSQAELDAEAAALVAAAHERCPDLRPLAVHGAPWHEAGASAAQELGAMLATAVHYVRAATREGLPASVACRAIALVPEVGHDVPLELAKLVALRRLWAHVAAAFGVGANEHAPFLLGRTSSWAGAQRHDLHTNLLRRTLAAFVAVTAGCDAVVVTPSDPDPDHQDRRQLRLATNQQLLLRHESRLGERGEALRGAYAVEALAEGLAREAWAVLQRIERQGGLVAAVTGGSLPDEIAAVAAARAERVATRRATIVGVNRYAAPDLEGEHAPARSRRELHRRLQEQHAARRARHDARALDRALAALRDRRGDPLSLLAGAADALRAGATFAEVVAATRGEQILHVPWRLPVRPPSLAFEELREDADDLAEHHDARPGAILVVADDARSRARAAFARDVLRAGGVRCVEAEAEPEAVAAAVRAERAAAVLVAVEDPAQCDRLAAAMHAAETERPLLWAVGAPSAAAPFDAALHEGAPVLELLHALHAAARRRLA